ncbi:hypothetical protein B0920_01750 [Massilia sp. KIM]|uniref:hypothetical protein n=1 Tax=Massilia sp. KIM TaxID=1955422 RepID=UPI00098FD269|nr:hypothetical protein [Massilia sp. KIM]OON62231.1 hypothetical protein B0920_01750 [Massilia sp. KIM]
MRASTRTIIAAGSSVVSGIAVIGLLFNGRGGDAPPAAAPVTAGAQCDIAAAERSLAAFNRVAGWSVNADYIVVNFNTKTIVLPPSERPARMQEFAASMACRHGETRKIQFYAAGRLIGIISPASGTWLLDRPS